AASRASMQSSCTLVTLLTVYEPLTTLKSGIDKSCVVTVVVSSAPVPPQPAMASAATHAKAIFLSIVVLLSRYIADFDFLISCCFGVGGGVAGEVLVSPPFDAWCSFGGVAAAPDGGVAGGAAAACFI